MKFFKKFRDISRHLPTPFNFDVDVVYTYVDGDNCEFMKKFKYWEKGLKAGLAPHSAISNRYKNYGELKYSLRSLEKFSPWVRNVYIVTSTQKPSWLNLNCQKPKVGLIRHEEIIPNEYLPLFNSSVIELYLAKIPGLTERFIYFNDDCFLGNFVKKSDFFTARGKCRLNFDKDIKKMAVDYKNVWQVTFFNSMKIIKKKFKVLPDFLIHQAHPFLKSACRDCTEFFQKEVKTVSVNKFRSSNDLNFNNIIYPFYALYKNKGVVSDNFCNSQMLVALTDNYGLNDLYLKELLGKKPKLFCLNDETSFNNPEIKKQVLLCLEKYFPEKSRFEL